MHPWRCVLTQAQIDFFSMRVACVTGVTALGVLNLTLNRTPHPFDGSDAAVAPNGTP
jgi:hypothetical protein